MGAIAGYNASIVITSSPSTSATNEAMTDAGDHINYTITNTAKKYWDKNATLTVQKSTNGGSTWNTVTNYTVQWVGGKVTFASANGGTDLIRASAVNYFTYATMGDAKTWELQLNDAMLETTSFTGSAWKTFISALNDSTIKLEKWWVDSTFLTNLTNGALLVLSLNTGANGTNRYECYAFTKQDSIKTVVAGLIEQSLDFQVVDQVYAYS